MIKLIKRLYWKTLFLRIYFKHIEYSNGKYNALIRTLDDIRTIRHLKFIDNVDDNYIERVTNSFHNS